MLCLFFSVSMFLSLTFLLVVLLTSTVYWFVVTGTLTSVSPVIAESYLVEYASCTQSLLDSARNSFDHESSLAAWARCMSWREELEELIGNRRLSITSITGNYLFDWTKLERDVRSVTRTAHCARLLIDSVGETWKPHESVELLISKCLITQIIDEKEALSIRLNFRRNLRKNEKQDVQRVRRNIRV